MFKKLKASLGIGATTVDTIVANASLYQGETLKGTVHIKGGDVEQQVDAIALKLCTEVKVESDSGVSYQPFVLGHIHANDPLVVQPGETKEVPFELKLHDEAPITAINAKLNQSHVWLETSLDIDFALDPKDRDYIEIRPLPVVQRIIDTIEREGFSMVKADVEKGQLRGNGFMSRSGCYQELEFRNSAMFNRKEIELSFILDGGVIHCLAEIDRSFGRGDTYRSFTVSRDASDGEVQQALRAVLSA
ncbi:sporulation protein [Enterovibrio nigricans]|uniref:Sporulation-control protein n=1 Tax=Enterovibrio nigricans DSM 22720 TaxID=1121868 RepID=A0A1T4V6Y7_9GAMM|nr:sporulation protein [Enterovibrio nigricans]PKF50348.1 sporulation control protein Spo0M [Enterovibrio nigricans]SKA60713.1 sporulation-control protein [Enterovibrio nigricans DSM 22720]